MALPGPLDRRWYTPEPDGDRPAAFDVTGDAWQRQGPRGTATWYCARQQLAASAPGPSGGHWRPYAHGRFWHELESDPATRPMTPVPRPALPDLPYTGEIALDLADTEPIPA